MHQRGPVDSLLLHVVLGQAVLRHPIFRHAVLGHAVLGHRILLHRVLRHAGVGHAVFLHAVLRIGHRHGGQRGDNNGRQQNRAFHIFLPWKRVLTRSRAPAVTESLNTRSSVPLAEMSHLPHSFVSLKRETVVSAQTPPNSEQGNFFEDFRLGQTIRHATPRTVTLGDVALYNGLFGPRFAVQSSDEFARKLGYPRSPLDDLLVFHVVFGKTVPDISLNAVANLGYADCRFLKAVYPGATLNAASEVIGLKENSNRKTGIVYVRSRGFDETGDCVLDYVRWVMVRKRDEAAAAPPEHVPDLPKAVATDALGAGCPRIDAR